MSHGSTISVEFVLASLTHHGIGPIFFLFVVVPGNYVEVCRIHGVIEPSRWIFTGYPVRVGFVYDTILILSFLFDCLWYDYQRILQMERRVNVI